jgi:hypothetical protein
MTSKELTDAIKALSYGGTSAESKKHAISFASKLRETVRDAFVRSIYALRSHH